MQQRRSVQATSYDLVPPGKIIFMEFGQISSYHSHKYLFINCVQKRAIITACIEANESIVGFAVFITYRIMLASHALRLGYFGIHIFLGFFYVICHIKAASQNMRIAEDAGVKGRSWN